MLPVVDGTTMHFPRIPTPSLQPRRCLRITLLAGVTPMTLDLDDASSIQAPGPSCIETPFDCQHAPAVGTPFPIPRTLRGRVPQPLAKALRAFYNVHGLCNHFFLVLSPSEWSFSPFQSTIPPTNLTNTLWNRMGGYPVPRSHAEPCYTSCKPLCSPLGCPKLPTRIQSGFPFVQLTTARCGLLRIFSRNLCVGSTPLNRGGSVRG